jgi:hypothetical protein
MPVVAGAVPQVIRGHRRITVKNRTYSTLIKKKIKSSSYIRKFRGIGCKVIYD